MSSDANSSNNIGLTEIGQTQQNNDNNKKCDTEEDENITSWRERINISIAKSRKVRGGNYVQISTVDQTSMEPRVRTVVFRGFLPDGKTKDESCIMKMITDKRSSKVQESKVAELCWWFAKSSEQYRIRGKLEFVGHDHPDQFMKQARKQQWGNLSDMAREQFYWDDPSIPFTNEQNEVPIGGRDEESGKVLDPPDNFLLMLLHPYRVDYLRLGDNYRQIDEIPEADEEKDWNPVRVNP
eukprot:CAMPEP_0178958940 /NCGR_PEP_ID=MMETSP0789-20121207/11964_1 /TAXON_ID=3005 /ORGANISM="Rhizosolenia setigera, Strain CCMP 1694" /LENGTH=238 /DNA_ID=CAMNT_0020641787 /DNA_START=233 /DNA_END=949 /DNA_ORIENTATION=-